MKYLILDVQLFINNILVIFLAFKKGFSRKAMPFSFDIQTNYLLKNKDKRILVVP